MTNETLRIRVNTFLDELGVPVSAFSVRVNLSASSLYRWLRGDIQFSEKTCLRISAYLTQYGF